MGTYSDWPWSKSGQLSITNYRIDRKIATLAESDLKITAVGVCNKIQRFMARILISVHTTRNRPRNFELFGRIYRKKPFISRHNHQHRLAFAGCISIGPLIGLGSYSLMNQTSTGLVLMVLGILNVQNMRTSGDDDFP